MYTYLLLSIEPLIKKKKISRTFHKIDTPHNAIKNIITKLPKNNKTYNITILEKETKQKYCFLCKTLKNNASFSHKIKLLKKKSYKLSKNNYLNLVNRINYIGGGDVISSDSDYTIEDILPLPKDSSDEEPENDSIDTPKSTSELDTPKSTSELDTPKSTSELDTPKSTSESDNENIELPPKIENNKVTEDITDNFKNNKYDGTLFENKKSFIDNLQQQKIQPKPIKQSKSITINLPCTNPYQHSYENTKKFLQEYINGKPYNNNNTNFVTNLIIYLSDQPEEAFRTKYLDVFRHSLKEYIERRENKEFSYSRNIIIPKDKNIYNFFTREKDTNKWNSGSVQRIDIIGISDNGNNGLAVSTCINFSNSVSCSRFNDMLRTNDYRKIIDTIDMYWRTTKDYWELKLKHDTDIKDFDSKMEKINQLGIIIIIKYNNKKYVILDNSSKIPTVPGKDKSKLINNIKDNFNIYLDEKYLFNSYSIIDDENQTMYYIVFLELLTELTDEIDWVSNKCDCSEIFDNDRITLSASNIEILKQKINKITTSELPLRIIHNSDDKCFTLE